MRRPLVVAGSVLAFVVLTAASCNEDKKDISVATVGRADVTEVVDAPASVVARAAATVTAPADGTLARMSIVSGDQVRKGQVLAVVDSPTAQQRLRQAKKALDLADRSGGGGVAIDLGSASRHLDDTAQQSFDQARSAAAHITDTQLKTVLLAQIAAAEKEYQAAAKAVASAVRGVQRGVRSLSSAMNALGAAQRLQAQQAYDLAKTTVDALMLRAPMAGVIQLGGVGSAGGGTPASLNDLLGSVGAGGLASGGSSAASGGTPAGVSQAVPVGGLVTAGTAIMTVVDVSELGLVAEVDETDILLVTSGVRAEVELDAATGFRYPATVAAIDMLPTANSRGAVAYRIRLKLAALPGGAPTPRPGMNAVAHLRVREAAGAVAVPAAAVFSVDGRDTVWVRTTVGKAERRPVTVGVSGTDLVQITGGLQPGERVVVRGADQIRVGDQLP